MMQKWLLVIEVSLFNVLFIYSIMILSIFMIMQILKLDNLHKLSRGKRPGHKIKHDTLFSELV